MSEKSVPSNNVCDGVSSSRKRDRDHEEHDLVQQKVKMFRGSSHSHQSKNPVLGNLIETNNLPAGDFNVIPPIEGSPNVIGNNEAALGQQQQQQQQQHRHQHQHQHQQQQQHQRHLEQIDQQLSDFQVHRSNHVYSFKRFIDNEADYQRRKMESYLEAVEGKEMFLYSGGIINDIDDEYRIYWQIITCKNLKLETEGKGGLFVVMSKNEYLHCQNTYRFYTERKGGLTSKKRAELISAHMDASSIGYFKSPEYKTEFMRNIEVLNQWNYKIQQNQKIRYNAVAVNNEASSYPAPSPTVSTKAGKIIAVATTTTTTTTTASVGSSATTTAVAASLSTVNDGAGASTGKHQILIFFP